MASNHSPFRIVGLNPTSDFEICHLKKLSSLVVPLWCPLVPEIIHGGLPLLAKLEIAV
jgi:hypothetical protein